MSTAREIIEAKLAEAKNDWGFCDAASEQEMREEGAIRALEDVLEDLDTMEGQLDPHATLKLIVRAVDTAPTQEEIEDSDYFEIPHGLIYAPDLVGDLNQNVNKEAGDQ